MPDDADLIYTPCVGPASAMESPGGAPASARPVLPGVAWRLRPGDAGMALYEVVVDGEVVATTVSRDSAAWLHSALSRDPEFARVCLASYQDPKSTDTE